MPKAMALMIVHGNTIGNMKVYDKHKRVSSSSQSFLHFINENINEAKSKTNNTINATIVRITYGIAVQNQVAKNIHVQ